MTLGTDLNLGTGYLNVEDKNSTLDMAGHSISGTGLFLGWYGSSPVNLLNRGALDLGNLWVGNGMSFDIKSDDQVGVFSLSGGTSTLRANVDTLNLSNGATATTTSAGSITGGAYSMSTIATGSTLRLGTDLNLGTGYLNIQDASSTLNANGHAITADGLFVGWYGTSSVDMTNLGKVTLNELYMGNSMAASTLILHGGDNINNIINLTNASVLTVKETGGIGLTLNGTSLNSLTLTLSTMDLIFSSTAPGNWDFRWKDPSATSNWISTIDTMIHDGQITLTLLPDQSYRVNDSNGYTYIYGIGGASVPEPTSIVLFCMGALGTLVVGTRSRKRGKA